MHSRPDVTIFLVDEDSSLLRNLSRLLELEGYKVETFDTALNFLSRCESNRRGIAILDTAVPDIGGLDLQQILIERNEAVPIIFMSGTKDIDMTVRTMRAGAVDFLTKPIQTPALLAAVAGAVALEEVLFAERMSQFIAQRRVGRLTRREREVLSRVVAGNLNKEIAADLGTAEKTIKLHRSHMMKKLNIRSVPDLVRLAQHAGVDPHWCESDYTKAGWPEVRI